MNRVVKRLGEHSTLTLVAAIAFLGFIIMLLGALVSEALQEKGLDNLDFLWSSVMVALTFGLWGTAGLVCILRKEHPLPGGYERYLRGWGAVILGGLVMLWGWGIALVSLFALLKFLVMGVSE